MRLSGALFRRDDISYCVFAVLEVLRNHNNVRIAKSDIVIHGWIQFLPQADWNAEKVTFAVVDRLGQVPLTVPNQLNSRHEYK